MKSKPTIVFLHGFLETKNMWNAIELEFKQSFKTIALNLPGHANTKVIGNVQTMEVMADFVVERLNEMNCSNFYLVGHSMGGYIGLEIGKKHPEKLLGLTLFFSTANEDSREKKEDRLRVVKLVQENKNAFIKVAIPNLFANKNKTKFINEIVEITKDAEQTSTEGIVVCLKGMKERKNSLTLLDNALFPIQIIAGEEDSAVPINSLKNHIERKAVKDIELIPNCGHMGHIEAKETCVKALKRFIK